MNDASTVYINRMVIQGVQGAGEAARSEGEGKSWLVALAKGLGMMLGEKAETMEKLVNKMENSDKNSKEFTVAMTEFQAESQMFSMLSNASSTSIKSIGEGLTANARKQ